MIYLHLPSPFVPSPIITLPAGSENAFFVLEKCANHATQAEPNIWAGRQLDYTDKGERIVRLIRFMGHARKFARFPPSNIIRLSAS